MNSWFHRLLRKDVPSAEFGLRSLREHNPALAELFLWQANVATDIGGPAWLHWGCGDRFFDGFVHVDFRPADPRVLDWDLLNPWPLDEWQGHMDGAFSEDVLEHFFLGEQAYILCNLNCLLKADAVSRILMPSYSRLVESVQRKDARPGGFLHDTFGVTTEVDAINMGLRFSGHRWLHDRVSFSHLAECCGFDAVATDCAESVIPELSNRNLRSESDSASFATDLFKRKPLKRLIVEPAKIEGAALVERIDHHACLYRATSPEPKVTYFLPNAIPITAFVCANIRSANFSSFRDHYYKHVTFVHDGRQGSWRLDETVKSRFPMNLISRDQIELATRGLDRVSEVRFKPANLAESFVQGPLEIFVSTP